MINLTSQMAGFALPRPAINDNFNSFVIGNTARQLPGTVKQADLDFLASESATLFSYGHALYSADFARKGKDGAVMRRDRATTSLFMDSGGFGFISGAIPVADIIDLRREALIVQQHQADMGVIVDVPTMCIERKVRGAETLSKCLDLTQGSLDYAVRLRDRASPLKLLNMIQGLTNQQAREWYDAVKYAPLDGFGFAGARRKDIALVLELLVCMIRDGKIDGASRFHVFGTNHPGVAILLTALQRRLRAHLGGDVQISFDSSTSFRFTQANGQIVRGLRSNREEVRLDLYKVADLGYGIDGTLPWPFTGPLADAGATVGDMLSQTLGIGAARDRATDTTGQMLLSHQSVWGELTAIIEANRLFEMEHGDNWKYRDGRAFPYALHDAVDQIDKAFDMVSRGEFDHAIAVAKRSPNLAMFAGRTDSAADEDVR